MLGSSPAIPITLTFQFSNSVPDFQMTIWFILLSYLQRLFRFPVTIIRLWWTSQLLFTESPPLSCSLCFKYCNKGSMLPSHVTHNSSKYADKAPYNYIYIYIFFFSSNTITKVLTFLHTTGCFNAIAIHLSTIPQGRMNNGVSCTPTARARIRTQVRGFAASHNNHCATEQGIW